ncbi:MAG: DMT family transporter [Proteobacteria bacterium]|nr:DMT family transporter [Pseudomonadota bacterium]
MRHSSLGIALKISASLAFSLMYAAIKMAGKVPVGEVIFFRAFFAMVPLFALSALTVGPRAVVRTSRPVFHVVRSAAGVCSMFMNFAALALLPLADITAFSFVAPIFAVVLSAVILHEAVGRFRWSAVAVGFAGVLLMIQPHGGVLGIFAHSLSAGAALALGGAFLSAFVVVFIRQMSVTERSETIVFYFMLTCSFAGAVSMIWFYAPLSWSLAAWLALAGILGGVGQICMTFSYRYAEPSLLAPFDYIAMVWAVLLGYFVFGEIPQTLVMAGAGVVIVAGLFIVWREHVRHRNVELAAQAVTPNV